MSIGWRVLMGSAMAYPIVQGAVSLGMSLPINRIDAALTAGAFGWVVAVMILSWVAGAKKILRMVAGVFVPSTLLIALLLTIPGWIVTY